MGTLWTPRPTGWLLALVVAIEVGACTVAASPSIHGASVPERSSDPTGPAATSKFQKNQDGLSLAATLSTDVVEPGGNVDVRLVVTNYRSTPATLEWGCEYPSLDVAVPLPDIPSGAEWPGVEGAFKTYELTKGYVPDGQTVSDPVTTHAETPLCIDPSAQEIVAPGGDVAVTLTWPAEIVSGVPAMDGRVAFRILVAYDKVLHHPVQPSPTTGPRPGAGVTVTESFLWIDGHLEIAGAGPPLLSAGQAIDVLLANVGFRQWLGERPESTWGGDLFLQAGLGEGIVPKRPSWTIELFWVPREWVIAYVDPFDGELLGVNYCRAPCDH